MDIEGILLIDKPKGMTSHDVVDILRKKLNIRKIGHTGTLDPEATGLLVMLIGKATKQSQNFIGDHKAYEVKLTLGLKTSTADSTGRVIQRKAVPVFSNRQIKKFFFEFQGKIKQIPPMVSAKKIDGKKLYVLARKGIKVKRKPQQVYVHDIKILKVKLPDIFFNVKCSKGTYIRTLCEDIGERLSCGAYMSELRRFCCGQYMLKDAQSVSEVINLSQDEILKRILPVK